MNTNTQKIVLCGGCFWCIEAVYKELRGVTSVVSGYIGGTTLNPTYIQVSSGTTGHAEGIEVSYDETQITPRDILTVFFASHDPTTLNRQGADAGTQYRSAIFYTTPEQKTIAEEIIAEINSGGGDKVVTELLPYQAFYAAESYHQDYYANNKNYNPYCEIVINPKLEKLQKRFTELLNEKNMNEDTHISEDEKLIKQKLSEEEYRVLRKQGTELPFTGELLKEDRNGDFRCKVCDTVLFTSDAKFDSGTGWPSFDQAVPGAVIEHVDMSFGMRRVEVVCANCKSHLGHVFDDGPTTTGQRYCINSVCLGFEPEEK